MLEASLRDLTSDCVLILQNQAKSFKSAHADNKELLAHRNKRGKIMVNVWF